MLQTILNSEISFASSLRQNLRHNTQYFQYKYLVMSNLQGVCKYFYVCMLGVQ